MIVDKQYELIKLSTVDNDERSSKRNANREIKTSNGIPYLVSVINILSRKQPYTIQSGKSVRKHWLSVFLLWRRFWRTLVLGDLYYQPASYWNASISYLIYFLFNKNHSRIPNGIARHRIFAFWYLRCRKMFYGWINISTENLGLEVGFDFPRTEKCVGIRRVVLPRFLSEQSSYYYKWTRTKVWISGRWFLNQ